METASSTVVFVHVGPHIPSHTADAIRQVARFSLGKIYLVGEERAIKEFDISTDPRLTTVNCEDIGISEMHQEFRRICPFEKKFREGFNTYTTERFFYLSTLVEKLSLNNIFHVENDVMVYADLDDLASRLSKLYHGLALPFDRDDHAVASFVYARNSTAWVRACEFMINFLKQHPDPKLNDMRLLGAIRGVLGPHVADSLPVLPLFHAAPLVNSDGIRSRIPGLLTNHADELGLIFDPAALGQYLGGPDPDNFKKADRNWYNFVRWYRFIRGYDSELPWPGPGFVNTHCVWDVSQYSYEWRADSKGRGIPCMVKDELVVPIANLHLHCKDLARFAR